MRKGNVLALFVLSLCVTTSLLSENPHSRSNQEQASIPGFLQRAKNLRAAGDFEGSSVALKEALELSRESGDCETEADCLTKLGIVVWDLGQIPEAAGFFEGGLSIAQNFDDKRLEHISLKALEIIKLYNTAKGYRTEATLQQSLDCFEQAIALARDVGIPDFELKCLRQKSLTCWQMDDIKEFLACNQRGLEIAEKLNHGKEQGRCLNNIGVYYDKVSDYSNALRYFEKALAISQIQDDATTQAESSTNIGGTYLEMGDLRKAETYYNLALNIDKTIGNEENLAQDLNNLGIVLVKKSQLSKRNQYLINALRYFKESLGLLEGEENTEVIIQVMNNIGNIQSQLGNYEAARLEFEDSYNKAKRLRYESASCVIHLNLGSLNLSKRRYQDAKTYFNISISEGLESGALEILWEAYYGLGQCYEAQDDLSRAQSYYEKSINILERIRERISLDIFKIGFVRNKLSVYESSLNALFSLYSTCPSPASLDRLFKATEKAKARAFLEYLIDARADIDGTLESSYREKEKGISNGISSAFLELTKPGLNPESKKTHMRELDRKEEEYFRLLSDMRAENRGLRKTTKPGVFRISDVQRELLDEHTALMEYFVGGRRSFLFLITRHHSELFELPGKLEIERSLRAFLKMLSSPSQEGFQGILAAERIAREIAFPLESYDYDPIDSLIIIPDGILHYLPFEALRTYSTAHRSYFIEKYQISYCPSALSLSLLKERPGDSPRTKDLLAIGAPRYNMKVAPQKNIGRAIDDVWREIYSNEGFSFSPLPYSKEEVQDIAMHFPVSKRDILLEDKATEAAVKNLPLKNYRIIHFACHGLLDEKVPFRSALVLSPDEGEAEDGFLQVREIYNLNMRADLVVLSACQTGSGALERTEGLLGLPRTFFYAGAHSVLSSLWPVNDKVAASFMKVFYHYLIQGQSRSGALRLAKLKMLQTGYSHPSYWAGYVLQGDPGPIDFEGNTP
jgi:CHAT domain-containing protein